MSEVLVRVRNKVQADPYLSCKLHERGDVIVVCADGWAWSAAELTNPDWRIIKLPNVTVSQVDGFLGPEFDTDPAHPSRMLRRRAFMLDIDFSDLPLAFKNWLRDDTRAAPTRTVNYTPAQFLALKVAKTPLTDPNVIG
jgi:hypothetical protein